MKSNADILANKVGNLVADPNAPFPHRFIVVRDSQVLGVYPSEDYAKDALRSIISDDKLFIFLKKKLLKLFFKGKYNPNDHLYYIAEVTYNETNFSITI